MAEPISDIGSNNSCRMMEKHPIVPLLKKSERMITGKLNAANESKLACASYRGKFRYLEINILILLILFVEWRYNNLALSRKKRIKKAATP